MGIASKVSITIDGKDLKDFLSFRVEQSIYGPHQFEVICRRDALETQSGFLIDKSIDSIGAPLSISIEGVDGSKSQYYFKGIITGLSATDNFGNSEVVITGSSTEILLADRPRCKTFDAETLTQIFKDVVTPYPSDIINTDFSATNNEPIPYTVQYKESNYQFLKRLAVRYGEWFFNDGKKLILGQPAKEKINLMLGLDLNSFDIALNLNPLNFTYAHYDYVKVNTVTSQSSKVNENDELNDTGKKMADQSGKKYSNEALSFYHHVNSQDNNNPKYLNKIVEIEKKARAIDMTHMSGKSTVFLKLGNVVAIKAKAQGGGSDVDYGEYLVTNIVHTCDNMASYQNTFSGIPAEAKTPPYTDPHAKPWCEIQSATIVERNDPDNLGRVKIRFPWQDSQQNTPWIRVSFPDAGKGTGFHSVPSLEDEVLVGFEGGDAEKPFVMGSVHNPTNYPSTKDLKDVKYIRSRKKHTILFDDQDGKEVLRIFTEDYKNCIDLDVANNKLTIHSDNDLILTGKKITIEAQDKLEIKAGQDVQITGGSVGVNGDTTIKGTKVSIKGDAEVKAEGAMVSVNGSATTEIKGGIVKIN